MLRSPTTIHKYRKELEEEDGAASGRKASISEVLQDLVERLSRVKERGKDDFVELEMA